MSDMMMFPDTVEEFMENYKIVDTDEVYTNGAELVPIFRMKQWFEHLPSAQSEIIKCKDCQHWGIHKRLNIPWCREMHIDRGAEDFCSMAERRTDE